ncbi:ABC transporter substrate-binding protein [Clostridium massiliodielmoense]|uniref:ABC transporter substrate-binding protein n=1 Tax=Clostridium massiliodielmoense TaxID=1776385 RepID=UPI000A2684F6|nr:ABC transporter substrate-binding protein [Clostridium massiliodielmoense]
MKNKIKTILILLVAFISALLIGCSKHVTESNNPNEEAKAEIKIATLKGPTGMGMVKLMEEDKENYEISLADSPDQIVSKIVNGELDAACVPSNLAAVLYNKMKGNVELIGANTLGVLYIVQNGNEVKKIDDLKGKTIYASGKGATPEFILKHILEKNGLVEGKDVNIEYSMQHSDLSTAVASNKVKIAVLPEPFVSITKMKNKNINVPIDLTKEWDKVSNNHSKLIMGTIIFRKDFVDKNKKEVNKFIGKYKKSVDFVNKDKEKASKLIEKYGIIPKAKVAQMAIPKCNIVFIDAKDAKGDLEEFYKILLKNNPKSLGGKIPDDKFYYENK